MWDAPGIDEKSTQGVPAQWIVDVVIWHRALHTLHVPQGTMAPGLFSVSAKLSTVHLPWAAASCTPRLMEPWMNSAMSMNRCLGACA